MAAPEAFCSQGRSRSFLDTLTNICVLEGMDPLRAEPGQGLPLERLSLMIHEYTHHWSMYSLVGTALSVTKIDAIRAWLSSRVLEQQHRDLAALERWQTVATLAGVWTEGLAQFAEFDASPGEAESATAVARAVLVWFGLDEALAAGSDAGAWAVTADLLARSRRLHPTIVRKAETFRSSFSARRGGYLSGYVLIKLLAGRLALAGGPFTDTDFALCYLKEFFFNDPWVALAALGLRASDDLLAGLMEHFTARVAGLMATPDEDLLAAGRAFDTAAAAMKITDLAHPMPGLGVDPRDTVEAWTLLMRRVDPDRQEPAPAARPADPEARENLEAFEATLRHFEDAVYRQRRFLCLGAAQVRDPRHTLLRSGEPVIVYRHPESGRDGVFMMAVYTPDEYVDFGRIERFEPDPAHDQGIAGYPEDPATLEIWCEPRSNAMYSVLFVGGRRVGIHVLLGSSSVDDVPFDLRPRDHTLRILRLVTDSMLDLTVRTSGGPPQPRRLGDEARAAHQNVCDWIDITLADLLLGSPGAGGRLAAAQLAERGLAGVPGCTSATLIELAGLTLSRSTENLSEQVTALVGELAALGIDAIDNGRWQI